MKDSTKQTMEDIAGRQRLLLLLSPVVLIFLFLSHHAANDALWTDDLFSLTLAEDPPSVLLERLWSYKRGYYDHPPLYFLLLHNVLFFGNTPWALRFLSMLFVGLAAGVLSLLARERGIPTRFCFAIGAVVVLHPVYVEMANFVRMYGLMLLLSSTFLFSIFRMMECEAKQVWKWVSMFSALLALMIYTSYFSLLLGAGIGLLGISWSIWPKLADMESRRPGAALMAGGIGALVLVLPWAPVIFKLAGNESANTGVTSARLYEVVALFREIGGGWIGGILIGTGIVASLWRGKNRVVAAGLLFSFFLIPFAILSLAAPPDRAVLLRYVIFSMPLILYVSLEGWVSIAGEKRKTLVALAVVASFFAVNSWYTVMKRPADWWAVADIIEEQATPREVIMTGGWLSGEGVLYHMEKPDSRSFAHYITDLDEFYVTSRDPNTVWFVNVAPLPDAYQKIIERYFPWRAMIEGNHTLGPITLAAKKEFTMPDDSIAIYYEPVPLEYEQ